MADINEVFGNLVNDLKEMGQEVGKRTEDVMEISKLKVERLKLKARIGENYKRLGEVIYSASKSGEDVSDVTAVLYEQLDDDFEKVEQIYSKIKVIKANYANIDKDGYVIADDNEEIVEEAEDEEISEEIEEMVDDVVEKAEDVAEKIKDIFDVDAD